MISPDRSALQSFEELLTLAAPQREQKLIGLRASDPAKAAMVERLLAEDQRATAFLEALPRPPLEPGRSLGGFRILRRLGAGGMGEVWEAEQDEPRRRVALKLLRLQAGEEELQRFRYEAQVLARLRHPHVAAVLAAGLEGSGPLALPWIAMELLDGARPLTDWCEERQLDLAARLDLFLQACDAVRHAHEQGVLHRDIKPSNLLVDGGGRLCLIDFGIARPVAADGTGLTGPGLVVGTLEALSPERLLDGVSDVRSDVWSLGAVLHRLVTGHPPWELRGLTPAEVVERLRHGLIERPSRRRPGLPSDLDWVLLAALERDASRRYGSVAELAADVARFRRGEPVLAGPPSTHHKLWRFVRRHRAPLAATTAVFVALIASLVAVLGALDREQAARDEADSAAASARDERDRARQVADLLASVFAAPTPLAGGRQVTMLEALDRAAPLLDDPQLDVRVAALACSDLARAYANLGRLADAGELLVRAVDCLEIGDPDRTEALEQLGLVLSDTLRHEEALDRLHQALGDRLASGEPTPWRTLIAIGRALELAGRDAEARALLHWVCSEGTSHLDAGTLAAAEARLVLIDLRAGRTDPAAERVAAALAAAQQDLGPHDAVSLQLGGLHGQALALAGRWQEAEAAFADVLEAWSVLAEPTHPDRLSALNGHAVALSSLGRAGEVVEVQRQLLEARRAAEVPGHSHRITAADNLGASLLKLGRSAEALAVLREAWEEVLGAGVVGQHDSGFLAVRLAQALVRAGEHAEGEAVALACLEARNRAAEDDDRVGALLLAVAATAASRQGLPERALSLRSAALRVPPARVGRQPASEWRLGIEQAQDLLALRAPVEALAVLRERALVVGPEPAMPAPDALALALVRARCAGLLSDAVGATASVQQAVELAGEDLTAAAAGAVAVAESLGASSCSSEIREALARLLLQLDAAGTPAIEAAVAVRRALDGTAR